ncbi:MAG: hypothetical protein KAX05_10200 [Bacteroidales bacterium]|nr:hypothetical protein [Bacteroidales bacterium]
MSKTKQKLTLRFFSGMWLERLEEEIGEIITSIQNGQITHDRGIHELRKASEDIHQIFWELQHKIERAKSNIRSLRRLKAMDLLKPDDDMAKINKS